MTFFITNQHEFYNTIYDCLKGKEVNVEITVGNVRYGDLAHYSIWLETELTI